MLKRTIVYLKENQWNARYVISKSCKSSPVVFHPRNLRGKMLVPDTELDQKKPGSLTSTRLKRWIFGWNCDQQIPRKNLPNSCQIPINSSIDHRFWTSTNPACAIESSRSELARMLQQIESLHGQTPWQWLCFVVIFFSNKSRIQMWRSAISI